MIFISYRHTDRIWAGRLCEELRRLFGHDSVYTDERLRGGENWPAALQAALDGCHALLALVGPDWASCVDAEGHKRLADPTDWVRREVDTVLRRGVLVLPLMLDNCAVPAADTLPEPLRPLFVGQGRPLRAAEADWATDLRRLADDLARVLPPDDVSRARLGLGVLGRLASDPAVAMSLGGWREQIETTCRQIERLEVYKVVHDALHHIEADCLLPIRAAGLGSGLRFRSSLTEQVTRIRAGLARQAIEATLAREIDEQLGVAVDAMAAAIDRPGADTQARVQDELAWLLSGLSPRLDAGMAEAASAVALDRLMDLMRTVRERLDQGPLADQAAAEPLASGIDAMAKLGDDLKQRVAEHTLLQGMDFHLRSVCLIDRPGALLPRIWPRVVAMRGRFAPPLSPAVAAAQDDLAACERLIDRALAAPDEAAALALLRDYFLMVARVFLEADSRLKDFCLRLSDVAQPLRSLLAPR